MFISRIVVPALLAVACIGVLSAGSGQDQSTSGQDTNGPTARRRNNHNRRAANTSPPTALLTLSRNPTVSIAEVQAMEAIDKLVAQFESANPHTTCVELSVQKGGKTIYEIGYGTIAKQPPSSVAPGPDTYFQIDSMTKAFTAFAVMRLVEEGTVDLDKPISTYSLKLPNTAWESIPVRQYLGMITGIPDEGTTTGTYKQMIAKAATATTTKNKKGGKPLYATGLDFEPGSQYEYSNTNYFILGELVNKVSGKSFINYTKDEVLTPLGMSNTGFIDYGSGDLWPTPYTGKGAQKPVRAPNAGFSGGGFTSTMRDLEKFAIAIYNRKILSAKSYTDMWTKTTYTSGTSKGTQGKFGLGWQITTVDSKGNPVNVNKGGGGWGWGSYLTVFPQTGDSVIILHNSSGEGGGLGGLTVSIEKVISGPSSISGGKKRGGHRRAGPQPERQRRRGN